MAFSKPPRRTWRASQKGYRQAIVEPGFDVQGLAHAERDSRVAHHRLSEGRVGGGKDGAYDGCLPETWGEWVGGSMVATVVIPLRGFATSLAYSNLARLE